MTKKEPQRTCVGCREIDHPDALIRVVQAPDGTVVPDLRARLPGRGAWVHPRAACLQSAARALPRALRGRVDASQLPERVRSVVEAALTDGLSMAAAGGGVVGGRSAVAQAVNEGRAMWVLLASDAADRTAQGIRQLAEDLPVTVLPLGSDDLGRLTGKAPRAVLAVVAAPSSVHLRRQLRRLRDLG